MPSFLLHVNAGLNCFHGAKATVVPSQTRVLVDNKPIANISAQITVAGCPFQVPAGPTTKPQPCVTVKWTLASTRFTVAGQPAALVPGPGPGPGVCQSAEQIPQGAPTVGSVQTRVTGS